MSFVLPWDLHKKLDHDVYVYIECCCQLRSIVGEGIGWHKFSKHLMFLRSELGMFVKRREENFVLRSIPHNSLTEITSKCYLKVLYYR